MITKIEQKLPFQNYSWKNGSVKNEDIFSILKSETLYTILYILTLHNESGF